jgi:hypothetical protein
VLAVIVANPRSAGTVFVGVQATSSVGMLEPVAPMIDEVVRR